MSDGALIYSRIFPPVSTRRSRGRKRSESRDNPVIANPAIRNIQDHCGGLHRSSVAIRGSQFSA